MSITCVRTKYDPNKTREQFLEERKKGFGASDAHHLLNVGPYACPRRLYLEKLELIPGPDLSKHMERGQFFEEPVAKLYSDKTGRPVSYCGTAYLKEMPYIRANADRMQFHQSTSTAGVLEIKCPAEWSFKKIKEEGPPETYKAQLQQQMLCYGTTWGTIAVYWPDGHELLTFDYERDEEMIAKIILKAGEAQADLLRNDTKHMIIHLIPGRPEADDVCKACPAAKDCWPTREFRGDYFSANTPTAREHAAEYFQAKKQVKYWEDEAKKAKRALLLEAGSLGVPEYGAKFDGDNYVFTRRNQTREVINADVKNVLTDEEKALYINSTTFEVEQIKEKK